MYTSTPDYNFCIFFILCYTSTLLIGMKKKKNIIWYIFVFSFASLPLYWPIISGIISYITHHNFHNPIKIFYRTHTIVWAVTAVTFSFLHIFLIRCIFHYFHQIQLKKLKHLIYVSFPICHLIYCFFAIKIILILFLIVSNFLFPFFPYFNVRWALTLPIPGN